MKKILIPLLLLGMIWASSCKKEEKHSGFHTTYQVSYPDRIFVTITQETDTSISLKWTKLDSDCFDHYYVLREVSDDSSNISSYSSYDIEAIYDQNKLTFTDKNLPLASKFKYQIVANNCYGPVYSNLVFKERTDIHTLVISNFKDALIDKDNDALFIMDNGDYNTASISRYNYADFSNEKTINVGYYMGYGDIGTYNSSKELYISSDNSYGSIYIYDANSLTQKAVFNHGEYDVMSVAYNNNQLFIGVDDYDYSIKCYSRNNFSFIDGLGNFYNESRVKIIPGTTTELFAIENYSEIGYYKFDANGNGLEVNETYPYNSSSVSIFEVSPDGRFFITGSNPQVYDKSLSSVFTLNNGNSYTTYAISEDGSKIYAAYQYATQIDVYNSTNLSNITLEKTINAGGYPIKIFIDGDQLISLSRVDYDSYSDIYAIEKININK